MGVHHPTHVVQVPVHVGVRGGVRRRRPFALDQVSSKSVTTMDSGVRSS
jgi:hypothetical protein